jgi:SAM-dependent methyltransferase
MNRCEFRCYRREFIKATREVLLREHSHALSEAAFPAYANSNPCISFLFWQRVRLVMREVRKSSGYERALDFGCGGGVLLPFLAQCCKSVTGLDIDVTPHKKLRTLLAFPPNIVVLETQRFPLVSFADSSMDLIVALDVLEHVDNLQETVANFVRMLTRRGQLIVSGPTENYLYKLGRRIAGPEYSGDYHVRNIYDIRDMLARHFDVETFGTLFPLFPLFKLYRCIPR